MRKLAIDPRLPENPPAGYIKNLVARLYVLLRDIIATQNGLIDGRLLIVTSTEKAALDVYAGMLVFDSTLGKACIYTGSAWETITSS